MKAQETTTPTSLTYRQAMAIEQEKLHRLYSPLTLAENGQAFAAEHPTIQKELDYDVRHGSPANSVRDDDLTAHIEDDVIVNAVRNGQLTSVYWSQLTPAEQRDAKTNIFRLYDF